MFEPNYSFFHHWLLFCRCVMLQKQYLEQTKVGGHKQPLGRARPPGLPVTTALAVKMVFALLHESVQQVFKATKILTYWYIIVKVFT